MDARENEKKETMLTDIRVERPMYNVYNSAKQITPSGISKQYIDVAKNTEKSLIDKADRYNIRLEKVDKSKPRTDAGIVVKHKKIQSLKKKAVRAEQKRDTYLSKNYRKQTIKKDIYQGVSNKLTEKVKSNLLGLKYSTSGVKKQTSNLMCLDKTGHNSHKGLVAPSVRKAKIKVKSINKTIRSSSNIIRNLKIQSVLDSENPALEVAKRGAIGVASLVTRLGDTILRSSVKLLLKLLMPLVPYLLLCFAPFILIIMCASGEKDTESKDSIAGGNTRNKVMERAMSYVGEDGTDIWEYYGTKDHWCCMFVWTCFNMEGAGELFYNGGKTALVSDIDKWALENPEMIVYYKNNITGEIIGDPQDGQYGDIVLYEYAPYIDASDHIALIVSYNENGSYTTIEGNTGGTGSGYSFYTSSSVHMYTSYLWYDSAMLHMIIRPRYNSIAK